jgi:hypothetical protein
MRDARGATRIERLGALIGAVRRDLTIRTQRLIGGAVATVPLDSPPVLRAALLQAIEAGGLEALSLIEAPVAIALGGGLAARGDGAYLFIDRLVLARLEVRAGVIRLVEVERADDSAALTALVRARRHDVAGVLAASGGVPDALTFHPDHAVLGAAMLAEMLG